MQKSEKKESGAHDRGKSNHLDVGGIRRPAAIEEALVNAMYHRGYDQREPVEVRVNPEGIDIVSYPGPDVSIRIEAFSSNKIMARRYRNRRIGELLKELELTEGRCTGIPKMREAMARNGSPPPRTETTASKSSARGTASST